MVRFCRRGAPNWAPTVQNRLKNRLNSKNQAGADSPDAPKSAGKSIGWNGAPEEIRTPDPQIRSLVLYPAELRVRFEGANLFRTLPKGKRYPCRVGTFARAIPRFPASIGGNVQISTPSGILVPCPFPACWLR